MDRLQELCHQLPGFTGGPGCSERTGPLLRGRRNSVLGRLPKQALRTGDYSNHKTIPQIFAQRLLQARCELNAAEVKQP